MTVVKRLILHGKVPKVLKTRLKDLRANYDRAGYDGHSSEDNG